MPNTDFQLIVIGAGPGGYVAAIRAAQLGFKVACVDKLPALGGTCLNVGCIPSKALLQSSDSYERTSHSIKEQGVIVSNVTFDFPAIMKRKEGIIRTLADGIVSHFKQHGVTRIEGAANFISPQEIEVNGQRYTAKQFIIASGSEPIPLPFLAFDEKQIVSSTGALSLPSVPKTMAVIGAGAIGVELASVYRRLGTAVTVIEMLDIITPGMDAALSKQLLQSLKKQGIEFFLGATVTEGKILKNGVSLTINHEKQSRNVDADVVLVAIGRKPYTNGLNLKAAGVNATPKGMITVDGNFRTSQPHIYAIGDVIDGPMLAHKASHEGIAVVELLAGLSPIVHYMSIPNVVYTDPEVASVGLTEAEATASERKILIGISHFRGNARARCSGDLTGFVKVIGDEATGRLLGMHIIGAHASELIAEGMIALDKKASLSDLANACHPHPTLSEAIMEACQQALQKG